MSTQYQGDRAAQQIEDPMPSGLLPSRVEAELGRILRFWLLHARDEQRGGFYGAIANDLTVDHDAPKGLVLCARILWTFARAYRQTPDEAYCAMAERALAYLHDVLQDPQFGGYYWSVDATGRPLRTKKQTYMQAFVLYAVSEYYLATGRQDLLPLVRDLFAIVERSHDALYGGYLEAFTRDWAVEADMRLGDKDLNEKKSMNTHLLSDRPGGRRRRKSFFAVAESASPTEGFRFWDRPIVLAQTTEADTNVYDMRLTQHEDGWIYGVFCTDAETLTRSTASSPAPWRRLESPEPETWCVGSDCPTCARLRRNSAMWCCTRNWCRVGMRFSPARRTVSSRLGAVGASDGRWRTQSTAQRSKRNGLSTGVTITRSKEAKNGQGPAPIKTDRGWLHIAHGIRNTAAGLRYVLYAFLSSLEHPESVTHAPGGYLLAPQGEERVGDVSNVVFCNGVIARANGDVYIYYASSDTRVHVASSSVDRLIDYVLHTPADPFNCDGCVRQRLQLIDANEKFRI